MQEILITLEIALARSDKRLQDLKQLQAKPAQSIAEIIKPIIQKLDNFRVDIMMFSDYCPDQYFDSAHDELRKYADIIRPLIPASSAYPAVYHKLVDACDKIDKACVVYDYIAAFGILTLLGEQTCTKSHV